MHIGLSAAHTRMPLDEVISSIFKWRFLYFELLGYRCFKIHNGGLQAGGGGQVVDIDMVGLLLCCKASEEMLKQKGKGTQRIGRDNMQDGVK